MCRVDGGEKKVETLEMRVGSEHGKCSGDGCGFALRACVPHSGGALPKVALVCPPPLVHGRRGRIEVIGGNMGVRGVNNWRAERSDEEGGREEIKRIKG